MDEVHSDDYVTAHLGCTYRIRILGFRGTMARVEVPPWDSLFVLYMS